MINKLGVRIGVVFLSIVSFMYGLEVLNQSTLGKVRGVPYKFDWYPSPFLSKDLDVISQLDASTAEYRRRMEFASFKDEKQKAAQQLLRLAEAKVNARPFEKQSWLELVTLQQLADVNPRTRILTAKSALFLGGWFNEFRSNLALICLESPPKLMEYDDHFCRTELAFLRLPISQRSLSLQGVSVADVRVRLDQLESLLCSDCEISQ